jgi:hypothetical protein
VPHDRIAVLVPGIMGSALWYEDSSEHRTTIWSDSVYETYRILLKNPSALAWTGKPARARLIERMYLRPWPKVVLWDATLRLLNEHPEFQDETRRLLVGYDWRQPLLDSARDLGERLASYVQEGVRFVFLTHSMGGLVTRIAVAQGDVPAASIDRLVHIGSPLEGAPAAFRGAYERASLPFLRPLAGLLRGRNTERFWQHVLDAIKSFPSTYQLMPPSSHGYVYETQGQYANPLSGGRIEPHFVDAAGRARRALDEAERVLAGAGVRPVTIYGENGRWGGKTDLAYRVALYGRSSYAIEEVNASPAGDGTVPKDSAKGSDGTSDARGVWNVPHARMCNSRKVIDVLRGVI